MFLIFFWTPCIPVYCVSSDHIVRLVIFLLSLDLLRVPGPETLVTWWGHTPLLRVSLIDNWVSLLLPWLGTSVAMTLHYHHHQSNEWHQLLSSLRTISAAPTRHTIKVTFLKKLIIWSHSAGFNVNWSARAWCQGVRTLATIIDTRQGRDIDIPNLPHSRHRQCNGNGVDIF